MKNKKFKFQKGQTLMEILIYVAIFGIVAASLVGIVWNITKIHSYQLASNEVDSNLRYAMNLINDKVRGASSIESATGSTLVLKMPNNSTTTFSVTGGVLDIQEGSAGPVAVISDRAAVSSLTFEKIDMVGAKGGARVNLTLNYVPKEGGTTSLQKTLISAVTRSATAITFSEDIVPGQDDSYSVGSASYNWKNGYFSGDLTVDGTISGTTFCINSDCKIAWPSGGGGSITGTGTANKVAKWTDSTVIGDSIIYDNGTNIGIGTIDPGTKLEVYNSADELLRLNRSSATYTTKFKVGTDSVFIINSGNSDVLTLKSGKVGIGTTDPAQELDVNGDIQISPSAGCLYLPNGGKLCGSTSTTCSTLYSPNGVTMMETCN